MAEIDPMEVTTTNSREYRGDLRSATLLASLLKWGTRLIVIIVDALANIHSYSHFLSTSGGVFVSVVGLLPFFITVLYSDSFYFTIHKVGPNQ